MNNQALHVSLPILKRYGHCNFTVPQLLVGFVLLVQRVTGDTLADAERVLHRRSSSRNTETNARTGRLTSWTKRCFCHDPIR